MQQGLVGIIRLYQMREIQTILNDVRSVCLSIRQSVHLCHGLNLRWRVHCTSRAVGAGSFGVAFVKLL